MKLTEMREILSRGDIRLTKSLGQNFLHDQNQLRRIASAGELTKSDKVLEIGPGLGPLTELLIANSGEVLAIEKDQRLVEFLKQRFADAKSFTLIHDDALDHVKTHHEWSDWKLIANLPYSVASPILVELAQVEHRPERLVATLQLEVAQRIGATRGDDNYGILSLLLQVHYESRGYFKIPASCFFPAPDVDSACITLVRRAQPLLAQAQTQTFTKLVKRAFSQRRKMVMKLLKQDWTAEALGKAFSELQLSPQIRAEEITLEQFVALTQMLAR